MENKEKSQSIKNEVKCYITLSGWQMGEVAEKLNNGRSKVALVKKITEIIGYEIEWKK